MGGEDWRLWMNALAAEGLLAPGARTVAYSYIGPQLTWPHLSGWHHRPRQAGSRHRTAGELKAILAKKVGGSAVVSVNKAVVTQASAAIPVVPLYLSLLRKVMGVQGIDESPAEQIRRLSLRASRRRRAVYRTLSQMKRGAFAWMIARCVPTYRPR